MHKHKETMTVRVARTLAAAAIAAGVAVPALAQDDRIHDTPTGWIYRYGASPATIEADVGNGFRPFSLQRTAPDTYDVVSVRNSGAYSIPGFSTAHTYFAMTPANLSAAISGERIVDLDCFDIGGSLYMSAVTIPNSGAQAAGWHWTYNHTSPNSVYDWAINLSGGYRLLDLEKYTVNGVTRWAGVAVQNTGAQAQGWWCWVGQTESDVSAKLAQYGARLIDIEVQTPPTIGSPATFAVLMVSENPGRQWFDGNASAQQISDLINQNEARLTALEHYTDQFGQHRYAVAYVDNANPQTRRVRDLMDAAISNGVFGFQIKQVGGSALAGVNQDFAFEPASMLKILHGAFAIDRCESGNDSLSSSIYVRDTCNNNECPTTAGTCSASYESLGTAIAEMLQQSDNNRTMEIELRYGTATLNNYATLLGLSNTRINHRLGCLCGNPFNTFSCTDSANLYEKIADGSLFSEAWRDQLFARMANLDAWGYGSYPTLSSVITQEAANTELTASEISAFRAAMRFANKGGGYSCNGTTYKTDGGWVSIPFKMQVLGNWAQVDREYTFGVFVHGSTTDSAGIAYSMKEEMFREQIRAALQSWDAACSTPSISNQPDAATRTVGQSVAFSASVNGTIGTRQWQKSSNGLTGWVNVAGDAAVAQTSSTAVIQFTNLTLSDAGHYRVVITSPCGTATSAAARLIVNPCPADVNASGTVTVQDVFDFLAYYFAGAPQADINGVGGVTVQDVFDFLSRYFGGC